MKTLILPLALLCFMSDEDGFTTVFDGKDLSQLETKGNWVIQDDGSLFLKPRPGEKGWSRYPSYLWLKGDYTDFVVDFEYKHPRRATPGFISGSVIPGMPRLPASRFRSSIATVRRNSVSTTSAASSGPQALWSMHPSRPVNGTVWSSGSKRAS